VLVPSLYKTSIVYAERPLDANGQLTFTRASGATRVGPDGYVEKVRTNLNANGNLVGLALNTAPTGYSSFNTGTFEPVTNTTSETGNFCKFTTNGTRSFLTYTPTVVIGQVYAFSYRLQALGQLTSNDAAHTVISGASSYITYINGVPAATGATTLETGVITIVFTASATSASIRLGLGVSGNYTGTLEVGNLQFETGDIATDYIPTTTTAVSVGPVSNLPRLNYPINADGSVGCPSLLLEPQRTNLLTYSEQFDNATWTKQTGITITANTTETLDPSGYYGADKLVSTNGTTGFFQAGLSLTSDITRSIYLKGAVGGETLKLKDPSGFGGNTIVTLTTSWVRYEFKTTNTGDTYQGLFVDDISVGTIYVWGAQLEAGAYATSYIPTLATSVTRVADACAKTGISSLIGQTEGTLFVEAKVTLNGRFLLIGVAGNFIEILINSAGKVNGFVRTSVTEADILSTSTYATGDTLKVAFAYKQNDFALYVNGTAQGTDTSGNVPTGMAQLIINDYLSAGFNSANAYSQALLFKTRLTNAQLSELTSL
jgi:hypothetical protein